jgi:hypothetical protein
MARLKLNAPIDIIDEGYPVSRCVDGMDVTRVAQNEHAFKQFGRIRRAHTEWRNSKTGIKTEAPEYARNSDDYDNPSGY